MLHPSVENISRLWFGANTPLRQFKRKVNPNILTTCQNVNLRLSSASGAVHSDHYRKVDKIAFTEAVLKELNEDKILAELNAIGLLKPVRFHLTL